MTPELWALGAVVIYGVGVLTGLAIVRCRGGAGRLELPGHPPELPPATSREIRRAASKRRIRLGLVSSRTTNKEASMAPPAGTGRGRHTLQRVG